MNEEGKAICRVCNLGDGPQRAFHSISKHLKDEHADWTLDEYRDQFPNVPLLSQQATKLILDRKAQQRATTEEVSTVNTEKQTTKRPMHEVFGLPNNAALQNVRGQPVMIDVLESEGEYRDYIPKIDESYVFDPEALRNLSLAFALKMPVYIWGYHGTGKTTQLTQLASRTNRPLIRVQHTANTEESHILGQWTVQNGQTKFQLGPLPYAMLHGLVYLADEYDFAMPNVVSVYQPVLEGEELTIKDAPPEFRHIKPHPDFRFCATGNTNGVGDETGLYQGTTVQNAANYSRFTVVMQAEYPDKKIEEKIVINKAGVDEEEAKTIVDFASEVRKAFANAQLTFTIGPRETIGIARLAMAKGGNWKDAIKLGFSNRLPVADRETVNQFSQRLFGN